MASIAEVTENRAAQWTTNKADRVRAECSNGADRGTEAWEEQFIKEERSCRPVDQKVIPFDRRA